MNIRTLIAAALLSTAATLACAQTQQSQLQDHDAHHPSGAAQASPQTPASPPAATPMGQSAGMMGGSSMMSMIGNSMPMMGMMQMMAGSGGGMGGMATIDRVEGRIAFLKTELKITDDQSSAWNNFAGTLRSNAKKLGELRTSMMPQAGAVPKTLADRLEWQEKWLTARVEDTRAIRSAFIELSTKFSNDQSKTADQILPPHMGMMSMMSGMGGGGVGMGAMGNMNSGQMDHRSRTTSGQVRPAQ
jgi:hypothetical protein